MNTRNFKRLFYITSVIVLASVIASAVIIELTSDTENPKKPQGDFSEATEMYILTSDGDRIVAYISGGDRPYIETTTAVSSLPMDVQKRINEGIEYASREELIRAIEEYCS